MCAERSQKGVRALGFRFNPEFRVLGFRVLGLLPLVHVLNPNTRKKGTLVTKALRGEGDTSGLLIIQIIRR